MRRRISLYIDSKLVDLDDDSLILFNYSQSELDNPTVVKNSYSQSISLPKTAKNNAIFGYMGRVDRIISDNIYNPLKRHDFVIYNEMNEILESGYVKVESIDDKYNVSLYGGLGGFFYSMSATEDGTKKTLADLYWQYDGINPFKASDLVMAINKDIVQTAWDSLRDGGTGVWSIVNFAPCYNGYPACKFGTDKAVYKEGSTPQTVIPDLYTSDSIYSAKQGANGNILLEFSHKHTEWDMQDLRSYLQRPVLSIKRMLQAFALPENTGQYSLIIDESVYTQTQEWLDRGWMTLRMFDRDNLDPTSFRFADILKETSSPIEYLIGFAKMMGCVFRYEVSEKKVTMMTRDAFYSENSDVVDINSRIDRSSSMKVVPYTMDAKYYIWDMDNYGEVVESEKTTGRKNGSQWVDTGYNFSDDQKRLLGSLVYKGAVGLTEKDIHFFIAVGDRTNGVPVNYMCKFKFIETVSWKMYGVSGGKNVEKSFSPLDISGDSDTDRHTNLYEYDGDYSDWMSRIQLHSADYKADTGENVCLFFDGMHDMPLIMDSYHSADVYIPVKFHLSDDTEEMFLLNNGQPCWQMAVAGDSVRDVNALPSFTRRRGQFSFDFAGGVANDLYGAFWRRYITDRYDKDTKVVRCKVDFSGIDVKASLLQRFFWFDNAVWVLSKISNYSLTTFDTVECEFIKVNDKQNYINGQNA